MIVAITMLPKWGKEYFFNKSNWRRSKRAYFIHTGLLHSASDDKSQAARCNLAFTVLRTVPKTVGFLSHADGFQHFGGGLAPVFPGHLL